MTRGAALFSLCALSCGNLPSARLPYQVTVLRMGPPQEGATFYALESRELVTLRDPRTLRGAYFSVLRNAHLDGDDRLLPDTSRGEFRYRVDAQGTLQPTDYESLVSATIFANLEEFALTSQTYAGISPEDLASSLGHYFGVYAPQFPHSQGGGNTGRTAGKGNAFWVHGQKLGPSFMGFLEPAPGEALPLAVNLWVLFHEGGHCLLDFLTQGETTLLRQEQAFLRGEFMRAVQEAGADLYAYAHTGVARMELFSSGLPDIEQDRDFRAPRFAFADLFANGTEKKCRQAPPYCLGTLLAGTLYQAAQETALDLGSPRGRGALSEFVLHSFALASKALGRRAQSPRAPLGTWESKGDYLRITEDFLRLLLLAPAPRGLGEDAWRPVLCRAAVQVLGRELIPSLQETGLCS